MSNFAELDALLTAAAGRDLTGAVAVVLHDGATVHHRAYGDAVTDSLFDLASVTKLFTATAFLSFVSAEQIHLDTPLVEVIPEFGASGPRPIDGGMDPHTKQPQPTPPDLTTVTVDPTDVTFWHLLTHTSGLAPWRDVFNAAGPAPVPPTEIDPVPQAERWAKGLDFICKAPFVNRVGVSLRYSDLGLMLLGEAVARLGAGTLDAVIRERVLTPLDLAHITYRPLDNGYTRDQTIPTEDDPNWRKRRAWGEVHDENACGVGGVAGHAGLFGTALDVAHFAEAWRTSDPRLGIVPALMDDAHRVHFTGEDTRYGLGWRCEDDGIYGHTGFTGTSVRVIPSQKLVVVLLTNRVYFGRDSDAITHLRKETYRIAGEAVAHARDGN
jgi:CubicO group peptidase (beta-lactamase class C family)